MKKILIGLLFCLLPFFAHAETAVPKLTSHLNDTANMVAPHLGSQIEARLANFEKETSNQIVILTVPSLDDDDIFSFSQRVFESWKLGQKNKDNGILVTIIKDRVDKGLKKSIRIHTGRGFEGTLPDITCKNIVIDIIKPQMKEGKYFEGLNDGIDKIIAATKGEYMPQASDKPTNNNDSDSSEKMIILGIFAFLVLSYIWEVLGGILAAIITFNILPQSIGLLMFLLAITAAFFIGWGIAWITKRIGIIDSFVGGGGSSDGGGSYCGGGGDSAGGGGGDGINGFKITTGGENLLFFYINFGIYKSKFYIIFYIW